MPCFFIKIEIAELCKGGHCVDLGASFQTHLTNEKLAKCGFDTAENEPPKVCGPSLASASKRKLDSPAVT